MFKLILKQTLARRGRLALTLVAVTLGITFVTGSLVLTDTSQRVFDEQFRTAASGVDLTVRDAVAFDSAMGVEVERDPLPPRVVDQVRNLPGVGAARAVVRGSGLIEHNGKAIVPNGPSMLSSWAPAPFGSFTIREGHAPAGPGEMVVDAATAKAHHIRLGDSVRVQSERSADLTVVGLAGFGDQDGLPNTTVALVGTSTAQRLLDIGAGFSEVLVVGSDDGDTAALRERLGGALGASYDVSSSRDTADASAKAAKNQLAYLKVMLLALAGAALLIGGFLIANTFSIVVSQRTRELAVLRAAGATGRQVRLSVLAEALVVGLAGSVAGVASGVLAALGLREVMAGFGVALPNSGMVLLPRTVLVAFLIGILVTTLAAMGPSRRAARVAPVEAMRAADPVVGTGRFRTGAGVTVAVAALAATLAGVGAVGSMALVGIGGVLAVAALMLLGPALAPRLARVVGRPLRMLGVPGALAAESAGRAPRRTAATVTALALSLALIAFMAVVASSVKASVRSSYEEVISADFVVESARGEMLGGLVPTAFERVDELDDVAVASRMKYGHWKENGATRALTAIEPETLAQVTSVDMVAGELDDLEQGGVVLAAHTAADRGLEVGDRLKMTFARTGTQRLPVVGLVDDADAQALSTDFLLSLDTYARNFSERMDAGIYVKVADGVPQPRAKAALNAALADLPTAEVRDQAAAIEGRTAMVDQILGLVSVLLLFTVLIALLGITNTLALSIVERTREIGLLRAVGMTRVQLGRMIRGEAMLIAALALVTGVVLGTGLGAAVVAALGETTSMPVALPIGQLLAVLLLATVTGLLAGLLPARRAGKLDVLDAIAE